MRYNIYIDKKYYKLSISESTIKMGNIPSFSIEKGVYCPFNCKGCYVDKTTKFRPNMLPCLRENTHFIQDLNKFNIDRYKNVLVNIINDLNCKTFRFNVSGDLSEYYLELILKVCDCIPDTTFYLYTKQYKIIKRYYKSIAKTKNIIVNISIMKYCYSYLLNDNDFLSTNNIKFFVTCRNEEEKNTYIHNYKICNNLPCLNDENKSKKCVNCSLCFNKNAKVVFNKYRDLKQVDKLHTFTVKEHEQIKQFVNKLSNNNYIKTCLLDACYVLVKYNIIAVDQLNYNRITASKVKTSYTQSTGIINQNNKYMYISNNDNKYMITRFFISYLLQQILQLASYRDLINKHELLEDNTIYSFDMLENKYLKQICIHKELINKRKFLDVVHDIEDSYPCMSDAELKEEVKKQVCYKHLKKQGLINVDGILHNYFK